LRLFLPPSAGLRKRKFELSAEPGNSADVTPAAFISGCRDRAP